MDIKNTHTHKCRTTEHDLLVHLDSFDANKSLRRIHKNLEYWCIRFHWNLHLTHYRAFQVENLKDLAFQISVPLYLNLVYPIISLSPSLFYCLRSSFSVDWIYSTVYIIRVSDNSCLLMLCKLFTYHLSGIFSLCVIRDRLYCLCPNIETTIMKRGQCSESNTPKACVIDCFILCALMSQAPRFHGIWNIPNIYFILKEAWKYSFSTSSSPLLHGWNIADTA